MAKSSFGIQCGKKAGIPDQILQRAMQVKLAYERGEKINNENKESIEKISNEFMKFNFRNNKEEENNSQVISKFRSLLNEL